MRHNYKKRHLRLRHWSALSVFVLWLSTEPLMAQQGTETYSENKRSFTHGDQQFSNPTVPGTLVVQKVKGSLKIEGYNGRNIKIEAHPKTEALANFGIKPDSQPITLQVEEKNNTMVLEGPDVPQDLQISLKVPRNTSIQIADWQSGDITIYNTDRFVEITSGQGNITLKNFKGWANLYTEGGNIDVSFEEVIPNKPMSFSALGGNVELEFPAQMKADFRIKSNTGQITNAFGPYERIAFENLGLSLERKPSEDKEQPPHDKSKERNDSSISKKKSVPQPQRQTTYRTKDAQVPIYSRDRESAARVPQEQVYIAQGTYNTITPIPGPVIQISSYDGKVIIKKRK